MKVYLIRHAQSEMNAMNLHERLTVDAFNSMLARSHSSVLTPLGEQQARAVAERLIAAPIERLYASPFTRALATAHAIGERLGLEPIIIDELREVVPSGLSMKLAESSLRRFWLRAFAEMAWIKRSVGPTWFEEYRRAKVAWQKITAAPVREVAAVSHGWLITLILLSLRSSRRWQVLNRDVNNCGISVVVEVAS